MSLWFLVVVPLIAHLYVHLGVILALYTAPVERFACGSGYRFWPRDWAGRIELLGFVVAEFWAFWAFMITYPLGWILPRRMRLSLHADPEDVRNIPVILIHGYRMNRFCMEPLRLYLRMQGFRRIYSLGLRRLSGPIESFARQLRDLVRTVDDENPGAGVFLVGHSMGGLVSALTLQDKEAMRHVRGIVAIGSPFGGTILHSVALGVCGRQFHPEGGFVRRLASQLAGGDRGRLVSIWSTGDRIVLPPSSSQVEGALANEKLAGLGHMSLLFSPRVFRLVRDYLLGRRPARFPEPPRPAGSEIRRPLEEHRLEHIGEERDLAAHP